MAENEMADEITNTLELLYFVIQCFSYRVCKITVKQKQIWYETKTWGNDIKNSTFYDFDSIINV